MSNKTVYKKHDYHVHLGNHLCISYGDYKMCVSKVRSVYAISVTGKRNKSLEYTKSPSKEAIKDIAQKYGVDINDADFSILDSWKRKENHNETSDSQDF